MFSRFKAVNVPKMCIFACLRIVLSTIERRFMAFGYKKYGRKLMNYLSSSSPDEDLTLKRAVTKSDIKEFAAYGNELYKGHPYYVPDLVDDLVGTLSSDINPAFDFSESVYYLAYRGDKIVGRIAGIINHKANDTWNQNHARFGFVDFEDDNAVVDLLFGAVEKWASAKGCEAIKGPLGFTDLDPEGMLIEGFDQLGTLVALYNFPYYPKQLERIGYIKDIDWLEFKIYIPKLIPERHQRMSDLVRRKYGLRTVKASSKKELLRYGNSIFKLINECYKPLYGVSELSERQIDYYTKMYMPLVNQDLISLIIREKDDKLVAFGITLPNLSKALQKAGGKLFPTGFVHLLKALKSKRPEVVDLLLIAVAPEYQNKGVNALIFEDLIPVMNEYQVKYVESNPELETNMSVMLQWNSFKKVNHKKRRSYIKDLL